MNNYFTTKTASIYLGVTPSRIRQLILEGRLKSKKIGRDHIISDLDIRNFIEHKKRKVGRPSIKK